MATYFREMISSCIQLPTFLPEVFFFTLRIKTCLDFDWFISPTIINKAHVVGLCTWATSNNRWIWCLSLMLLIVLADNYLTGWTPVKICTRVNRSRSSCCCYGFQLITWCDRDGGCCDDSMAPKKRNPPHMPGFPCHFQIILCSESRLALALYLLIILNFADLMRMMLSLLGRYLARASALASKPGLKWTFSAHPVETCYHGDVTWYIWGFSFIPIRISNVLNRPTVCCTCASIYIQNFSNLRAGPQKKIIVFLTIGAWGVGFGWRPSESKHSSTSLLFSQNDGESKRKNKVIKRSKKTFSPLFSFFKKHCGLQQDLNHIRC